MAGIAHIGLGLAAKPAAPRAPLGALVLAAEVLDILWGVFVLAGVERMGDSPWSHGLFMSAIWSLAAGLLAAAVYRHWRTGAVIGLVVFSHWLLDWITHPMFGGPPDLPLLFRGSPMVGLGLYPAGGPAIMALVELGLPLVGLAIYRATRQRAAAQPRA